MKPLLSIIIPAHNEEEYILHLLDSLKNQSFNMEYVEIIVIDNNSTDSTYRKVIRYLQQNPKLGIRLVKERVPHVSAARNKGARIAHGETLVFLDADNVVSKTFLQDIYNKVFVAHYEAGTIFTLPLEESLKGHMLFLVLEIIKLSLRKPFGKNFCSRNVFHKVGGYNEKITIGTNVDFLTRVRNLLMKEKKSLAHIQKPIYASLRRFENKGYEETLFKWFCGYAGIRKISY